MITSLSKKLFRKKWDGRHAGRTSQDSRRYSRLTLEALEKRTLLSTAPVIYSTLQDQSGSTLSTAQAAPLAPMMETRVLGSLANNLDVDMFQVNLTKGEIFTANVLSTSNSLSHPKLSLLNNLGTRVTASLANNGQSLEYRVPQTGTYYVDLGWTGPASAQAVPYELDLRPIGLNTGNLDPSYLANTNGGLYAWRAGHLLDISGPVGYGFSIRGNWTETVSYVGTLPGATYTAVGTVYLETPQGEVAEPLASGSVLSVTTQPQLWGNTWGEIGSVNWSAPPSLPAIEAVLGALYPSALLNLGIIGQTSKVSIGLGTDPALQNTSAPLHPAIPYLYFTDNPASTGATQAFSVIVDPADPFLYVGSPLSPLSALAASQHGLIPFTPAAAPSQWQGNLHGYLFIQGSIDLAALTGVPAAFKGSLTLDLNPDNTGFFWANPKDSALLAAALLDPTQLSLLVGIDQIFQHFSAGLNGELDIAPFNLIRDGLPNAAIRWAGESSLVQWILDQKVPRVLAVANATVIYDGPTLSAYFHGGTASPFDGTALAPLAPTSAQVDAAIKPGGAFYLDVQGSYKPLGLNASGEVKLENNWPTLAIVGWSPTPFPHFIFGTVYTSAIYADLNVNVLGATVDVHGQVQGNGNFDLTATGSFSFAGLGGSANFDLNYTTTAGFSFTAVADASYQGYGLSASLVLSFSFGVDSYGNVTYSGSGTASVGMYFPWPIGWQTVSVGVGINNSEIWFYAFGIRVDIYYTW